MEIEKHYVFNENLMIGIVDLTKTELATEEDKRYHIDEWARLFKAERWEEVKMLAAENANIAEAAKTMYELSQDERIRQQCLAREDYYKRQSSLTKRLAKQEMRLAEIDEQLSQKDEQLSQKDRIIDQQREQYIQLLIDKGFVTSREEAVRMVDNMG